MDRPAAARVTVRQFTTGDLPRLLLADGPRDQPHHVKQSQMQERGEATYLLAWNGDQPCGRVTLLHRSENEAVRAILGNFPEMNALVAYPQRLGIGSELIASAEERSKALGAGRIGLAVEHTNVDARRLYERLGYVEWEHGDVIARWTEHDGTKVVRERAELCSYLVKELDDEPSRPA